MCRRAVLSLIGAWLLAAAAGPTARAEPERARPHLVFLIADDLGDGDLGCYGQTKIRTPNLDRLARAGMRFTAHYAGSNVCAPSRCVLMTGRHPGHGTIRENRQAKGFPEGQEPVPAAALQLPRTLKRLGYTLGGFGKWGLGPAGSTGDPPRQGFDRWFGYNCPAVAHNYYPTHLWDNDRTVRLDNPTFSAHQRLSAGADPNDPKSYTGYTGRQYAPDLIRDQALAFIRANRDRPFVLCFPTPVPHLALLAGFLEARGSGHGEDFVLSRTGLLFRGLTARNLAALHLADLLDLPGDPRPDWTAAQWAALREKVRRALPR